MPCLLAELSSPHASYLVHEARMTVIRLASFVYLPCLRSHVLRAYCTFASKQAVSIALFGQRPNNYGIDLIIKRFHEEKFIMSRLFSKNNLLLCGMQGNNGLSA